ncbi:MAG TPA: carboxypeptidase-like regulatory domain-containing protein [Candidatus Udaeobacter sp.]|nr:carboxypeptidase-like regulatory domain-containing protein [Candidatus Udaeobacter sp.]
MTTPDLRQAELFRKLSLFGIAALFLLPTLTSQSGLLTAQKSRGKPYALIAGTVWGPDDRPVYGVSVKIRKGTDKPKKVRWEVYSDHMGEFAQRVPPGEADYILWADLKGFKPADGKPLHLVQQVTIHVYNDERQDVGLHLAH